MLETVVGALVSVAFLVMAVIGLVTVLLTIAILGLVAFTVIPRLLPYMLARKKKE